MATALIAHDPEIIDRESVMNAVMTAYYVPTQLQQQVREDAGIVVGII